MARRALFSPGSDRIQHDLAGIGLPEVPLLGVHDERHARRGLVPHVHPGLMEICYLTRGERVYHVNRHDYPFRGNEVFVTYPDELHGSGRHPHGKGVLYWLHLRLPARPAPFLTLSARDAWPLVQRLRHLPHRRFLGARRLKALYEEMLDILLRGPTSITRIEIATRLIQWLLLVAHCAETESARRTSPDIQRACNHVAAHLDEPSGVEALARLAGLSASRFKVKFKEQTGVPPAEYVIRCKVAQAREWLAAGRPVTDVAFALGFASSQYFATAFKRITSLRPREVRATAKGLRASGKPRQNP
jgi:AraC-like DNA-binding protein